MSNEVVTPESVAAAVAAALAAQGGEEEKVSKPQVEEIKEEEIVKDESIEVETPAPAVVDVEAPTLEKEKNEEVKEEKPEIIEDVQQEEEKTEIVIEDTVEPEPEVEIKIEPVKEPEPDAEISDVISSIDQNIAGSMEETKLEEVITSNDKVIEDSPEELLSNTEMEDLLKEEGIEIPDVIKEEIIEDAPIEDEIEIKNEESTIESKEGKNENIDLAASNIIHSEVKDIFSDKLEKIEAKILKHQNDIKELEIQKELLIKEHLACDVKAKIDHLSLEELEKLNNDLH